jgi:hypothetical protein
MSRLLLRWPWVLGTIAAGVLLLTAFQGEMVINSQAVSALVLSAIGLAILSVIRNFAKKASAAIDQFGEVMGALYGPKDGNGERSNNGYLAKIDRITTAVERIPDLEEKIENVAVEAATAASAARLAQKAAADAISGKRDPGARTRAADRDDG